VKLQTLIDSHKVVITVGAGGVGKTTLAAAIGVHMARQGKRVMVVTIDPAKRLATALGIGEIGGTARRIDLQGHEAVPGGFVDIMMLDAQKVFTDLIHRTVTDDAKREKILNNKFFKLFTEAMGGTQEHSAVEKLADLLEKDSYDLIILDTPPSRHALEFLTSPRRIMSLLDDKVLRWLAVPAGTGMAVFSFGSKYIGKILSVFAGAEALAEVSEFIAMSLDQFRYLRDRAVVVDALLRQHDTLYLVVGSPERHGIEGALMFHRALTQDGYQVGAYIINRVRKKVPGIPGLESMQSLYDGVTSRSASYVSTLKESLERHCRIADIHLEKVQEIIRATGGMYPVFAVPAFVEEIVSISGVMSLADRLFDATSLTPAELE